MSIQSESALHSISMPRYRPSANPSPQLSTECPCLGECIHLALRCFSSANTTGRQFLRGFPKRLQDKPRVLKPEVDLVAHRDAVLGLL